MTIFCPLKTQGIPKGRCLTYTPQGDSELACQVTFREDQSQNNIQYSRLVKSIHLSRPEDYLSVYQSGCNHDCKKCHSSEFSKQVNGEWINCDQLAMFAKNYLSQVTVFEPRHRATMFHADDLCLHCGSCVIYGKPAINCPRKLTRDQIVLSPQGFGPARNIIAFTGGDLTCRPEFYAQAAAKIKKATDNEMWVLIETNGYALTKKNLEILKDGGVDSYWLDIKAYDRKTYQKLCGTPNSTVLSALSLILS